MKHMIKSMLKLPWIGIFGSVLIFGSWVLQNRTLVEYSDELDRLTTRQLQLDLQQVRQELWGATFNLEKDMIPADSGDLRCAAYKMIQSLNNLSTWSADRLVTDQSALKALYDKKDSVQKTAKSLLRQERTSDLIAVFSLMNHREDSLRLSDQQTDSAIVKRNRIMDSIDQTSILFFIAYVFGSVLIGIQWLRSKLETVENE